MTGHDYNTLMAINQAINASVATHKREIERAFDKAFMRFHGDAKLMRLSWGAVERVRKAYDRLGVRQSSYQPEFFAWQQLAPPSLHERIAQMYSEINATRAGLRFMLEAERNAYGIMEQHQAIADEQRARFNAEVAKFNARRAVLDIDC